MGYDSDHPVALGEVGKVGVPISSLRDMEILFDGIPLDKVSTSMTINATASMLLCLYAAVAKQQGLQPEMLNGTIQNDILKEYIARGTYIYPPRPSMRLVVDVFKHCAEHMPRWNTISISGYHMREAGCTAAQELAFTFSNAIEYVQAAVDAGLEVDTFGPRLSFFFASHNNLLEEVAKFRAARRTWARIMRERFKATNPPLLGPALPHADRGRHPHGPAARQQRGALHGAGVGRRPGRHPVPACELPRRGPWPCRRRSRSSSPCARSRCWRTRAAWPTLSTRWGARTTSSG